MDAIREYLRIELELGGLKPFFSAKNQHFALLSVGSIAKQ